MRAKSIKVNSIEEIRKVWNEPMAGMFSNAEPARAYGGNLEMHNCTAVVQPKRKLR